MTLKNREGNKKFDSLCYFVTKEVEKSVFVGKYPNKKFRQKAEKGILRYPWESIRERH